MTPRSPSLAVLLSNYNHGDLIGEALDSILNQSLRPTTVIVVDDASTDNSLKVIEQYVKQYDNVQLVKSSKNTRNQLHCQVSNEAIISGTTDYVYVAAADDKVLPGFFERAVSMLESYPESGICVTYPQFLDAEGQRVDDRQLPSVHSHARHAQWRQPTYLSPQEVLTVLQRRPWFIGGLVSAFFRRTAIAEAGGLIPELGLLADWFVVHAVALRHGMCYIPEPLVAFRVMRDSVGRSIIRRPELVMEQHVRALRLMRMPKYRQVFPPSFVDQQKRGIGYVAFRGAFANWQGDFLQDLSQLLPPQTLVSRTIMWLLRNLLRLQQAILKAYCYQTIAPTLREE